jgi:hypothetical protein
MTNAPRGSGRLPFTAIPPTLPTSPDSPPYHQSIGLEYYLHLIPPLPDTLIYITKTIPLSKYTSQLSIYQRMLAEDDNFVLTMVPKSKIAAFLDHGLHIQDSQ